MKTTVYIKALLPLAFFGYAGAANLVLLTGSDSGLDGVAGFWNGKLTQQIDALYRDNLPHKDPAIGWIGAARYLVLDEGRPGVVVGRDGTLFTSEEFRSVAASTQAYEQSLDEVLRTAEVLKAQGVELVVAPLPAKVDLLERQSPDSVVSDELEALYHQFVADLAYAGVPVIDTRPALSELDHPFLTTDTHWTPDGAGAVARLIADSGVLPLGETAFAVETDATARFVGDLVTYVTSDALAPRIGLVPEEVVPYRAVAEAQIGGVVDIFGGGDVSDTLDLVGTSYSANPNWSFAEALKLSLARDVINYAEEGQGPFAPMRSYLDARNPLDNAEQVLWEIPVRYLTEPRKEGGEA